MRRWLPAFVRGLLWAALAWLLLRSFAYHSLRCTFPYQLVPSEAGMLQSVRALMMGLDPWAPANAWDYSNDYGVGFPWLVARLRPLGGSLRLLPFMRLVSAGAAFWGLALLASAIYDEARDRLLALAAAAAIYAGLLYYDTLTARPDALAFAFYASALLWALRPGRGNAAAAGALAAVGFLVKPYAVLALPVAGVMLWAQGRRREVAWLGLGAGLGAAAVGLWIATCSPYYLDSTYLIHLHATRYSVRQLLDQWRQMALNHWPLLAGLAVQGWLLWRRRQSGGPQGAAKAWAWAALAVFVALLGPGGHVGAFLRYYQQLFLPVAIVAAVLWLAQGPLPRWALILLLLADGLVMMRYNTATHPMSSYAEQLEWRKAEAWVRAHPYSLLPSMLTSVAVEQGAYVFATDHNYYLPLLTPAGPVRDQAAARVSAAQAELLAGHFQGLTGELGFKRVTEGPQALYRRSETICLQTPLARMPCVDFYERWP